ncbi:MAG TPA: PepSY-associated TM helix domain-containing protein [Polyangiaceae bacterium]|nr:PepSY-associated TM helix domain-containing protein [Polyangiaceae bacterium]
MLGEPLRRAWARLHTWAGVVLGGVLFAVFWMGTLSVFDHEIDRWMMPPTRLAAAPPVSLDAAARAVAALAPGAAQWSLTLPSARTPTVQVRLPGSDALLHLDPSTFAELRPAPTLGGTGFIFPFHFMLHIDWLDLGLWIVGLCGMAMLVLTLSGVLIHKRILRDFFMFRPRKAATRSLLDLHTALGVLALPFHLVMPLSGLVIFFALFFPGTWQAAFDGDEAAFGREVFGSYQRPTAGAPGTLSSLDAMAAEAQRRWQGGRPFQVRLQLAGDAASYVEMRRAHTQDVSMNRDAIYFDAATGAVLERFESKPIGAVQRFIAGIHFVQFEQWLLRWLYFCAGLAGCVMIATGLWFWLESRRAEHARRGWVGVRLVEALATGSVSGIIAATLAFFIANRCLPEAASAWGLGRQRLELVAFYGVWLGMFCHAGWRGRAAWGEQCAAIAGLSCGAVALNWITTGDHPLRALSRGATSVAAMDGVLLLLGVVCWLAARRWRVRVAAPEPALELARGVVPSSEG